MMIELIILIFSLVALLILYTGRIKSGNGGTFLFSNTFLVKADENIFGVIAFVFKKYSKISHSVSVFLGKIPHAIANTAHKISRQISNITHRWVEKIKNRSQD